MNDPCFEAFCAACDQAMIESADPRHRMERVAQAMRTLLPGWRIADGRYEQVQPEQSYGSYLLYATPQTGLTVVLDVFAPGQAAVIHQHGVWGVIGCIHGRELETVYAVDASLTSPPVALSTRRLEPGTVVITDPHGRDFHQVECEGSEPSISLHVYGADIGRLARTMWDRETGRYVSFSSGYSNEDAGLGLYLSR
jgi:predicted metal-dependent enzyme (double-stranded beta helix superfamily)